MSMISAQIDELRNAALGQKAMGLFELAQMLNDAADTIWQLRDDLQRTNGLMEDVEHDESRAWDRVRKAEADDAKLRELVREMYAAIEMADYVHDFDDPMHLMFLDDMRKLGVEVDG